ncbi:MAG: DUF2851 family protein [Saprospiraceae bacterium]|nr:DUF2851 family protein [Saprospiraceae bacterium]
MKEDLLHYFWRTKKWATFSLKTTKDENLEIIYPGDYNQDQGPDFNYAKIKIGGILWSGKVEMHIRSSDWIRHQHQDDSQYNNVILHVVWEHDQKISIHHNELNTLELKEYISQVEIDRYDLLINNLDRLACSAYLSKIPNSILISQLEDSSVERLQQKVVAIQNELDRYQQDWDRMFFNLIGRYLMGPVNQLAFDRMSELLDYSIIRKEKDKLLNLESLLFGCSGFLGKEFKDEYLIQLTKNFDYLKHKYQLHSISSNNWYFSKLRPAGFPSIRIAQLASLIHQDDFSFLNLIMYEDIKDIIPKFKTEVSEYWQTHYQFNEQSHLSTTGHLGRSTIDILFINVLIPLTYHYGKTNLQAYYIQKSFRWLEQLSEENNKYSRIFTELGVKIDSARLSQGCIHQFKNLCSVKKCLHCKMGHFILKGKVE